MKRALIVSLSAAALVAAGGASWYFFNGKPTATPGKTATATQTKEQPLNPEEFGIFDVDFSQKMIAHHQQAIEMADVVLAKSTNQPLRDLATQIREKQIIAEAQYKSWLTERGETYTDLSKFPQMDGHDMYPSYPGLVSATNMGKLRAASGAELDKLFIDLMIEHHKGGIQTGELSNKLQFGKLIDFKKKVFGDYDAEIKQLEEQ